MTLDLSIRDLVVQGAGRAPILSVDRLDVAQGARVAIRGPSGAGKSTLLHVLSGLLVPREGRVRWGETDLARLGEDARAAFRRETMGMVFQDFLLFEELGASANAAISAAFSPARQRRGIAERAGAMLASLGLGGVAERTVDSFSGGERQRVAVARALAHGPSILLADEPTASLDRETADRLVDDLLELASATAMTVIMVSHDPAVHRRMDRIIDVVDGRLADTVGGSDRNV